MTATLQKALKSTKRCQDQTVRCFAIRYNKQKGLANEGSFVNLFGCEDFREKSELPDLSCENMVSKKSPPAFIWQTVDDDIVPSENSLIMASALKAAGVPFELHMYESGPHGLSVCDETSDGVEGM